MQKLLTQDGTYTFYNETFDQHYHTKSGAYEEAVEKHVKPTNVKDNDVILDFCFGMGYNSLAAVLHADNLQIVALEIDEHLLYSLDQITFTDKHINEVYQDMVSQIKIQLAQEKKEITIGINTSQIRLIIGDATQEIKHLPPDFFDVIFFDPFSPDKHPQMWDKKVFIDCHTVLKKQGVLSTYSCARKVRDAMKNAHLTVTDGPIIGRRSPSTLAYKP